MKTTMNLFEQARELRKMDFWTVVTSEHVFPIGFESAEINSLELICIYVFDVLLVFKKQRRLEVHSL
jgi:hypothetical protein